VDCHAAQRVERDRRARQAHDEYIAPALTKLRAASDQRIAEIVETEPWATEKIAARAMISACFDRSREGGGGGRADGDGARHDLEQIERVSSMSAARKKAPGISRNPPAGRGRAALRPSCC